MKPINFQSRASVVCFFSHNSPIYWFLPAELKCVFPTYWHKKQMNIWIPQKKITRNWNVNLVSALITSWDITEWCRINLLWKELIESMSEHTGLISSCQLLITVACANTGGMMKGYRARAADRCPFVHRYSKIQVTSFMGFQVVCIAAPTGEAPTTFEWSTILLPNKVRLILETLRCLLISSLTICCFIHRQHDFQSYRLFLFTFVDWFWQFLFLCGFDFIIPGSTANEICFKYRAAVEADCDYSEYHKYLI